MEDTQKNKVFHIQQELHIHELIEMLETCTVPAQNKARCGSSAENGSRHIPPSVTQKLSSIDTCLQMNTYFSTTESHWVNKPFLSPGHMPCSRWQKLNKVTGIIGVSIICFPYRPLFVYWHFQIGVFM